MKSSHGMTLVELMGTLAVMAILSSVALPTLTSLSSAARADAAIRQIASMTQLARNHAISYGVRVTLCPIQNSCCSSDWSRGFAVFNDTGSVNCIDGSDELIGQFPPIPSQDILKYSRSSLRFLPDGLASGANGTFRYCPDTINDPNSKALIVNNAGRSRMSTDNIHCQ